MTKQNTGLINLHNLHKETDLAGISIIMCLGQLKAQIENASNLIFFQVLTMLLQEEPNIDRSPHPRELSQPKCTTKEDSGTINYSFTYSNS